MTVIIEVGPYLGSLLTGGFLIAAILWFIFRSDKK